MRCNFFQCGHLFKCQTDRRGWKYEIRRLTQQREKPYLFCLFTSTVLFKWGSFIFYESRWKLSEVLKLELRYKPKMCSLIHDTVTFNTAAAAVFINVQRSWSSRSCVHARAHLMGPSQHNCHFAPLLQVLHTGELAALTDASSLGFMGNDSSRKIKLKRSGKGRQRKFQTVSAQGWH